MDILFRDRAEAGRRLAEKLATYVNRDGVIVLALPRGGVPIGYEVAHALKFAAGCFHCAKAGHARRRRAGDGRDSSGGVRVLNEEVVQAIAQRGCGDQGQRVESRSGAVELGSAVTVFPTLSVCRCLNI